MPRIIVGNNTIEFPDSATEPNWAEGVIDFATSVAENLNQVVGQGDVLPNSFSLDAVNGASDVDVPGFTFDTTIVQSTRIDYSLIRERDSTTLVESGNIQAVYNPNGSTNQKWTLTRDYTGEGQISFDITDNGQVQISTTAISGVGSHTGTLHYRAQSLLNS